jgi:hypothetical protein
VIDEQLCCGLVEHALHLVVLLLTHAAGFGEARFAEPFTGAGEGRERILMPPSAFLMPLPPSASSDLPYCSSMP